MKVIKCLVVTVAVVDRISEPIFLYFQPNPTSPVDSSKKQV